MENWCPFGWELMAAFNGSQNGEFPSLGSLAAADGLSHLLMLRVDEGIYFIIFYGRTSG